MTVEKKEVIDYLRNQQKAAEIEAKINGVNVWVLIGAIAVVGWQLASVPSVKLWNDYELIARALVVAVSLQLLSLLIARSGVDRDELRYSRANFYDLETPFLVLLNGILLCLPTVILLCLTGMSVGVFVLGIFGFVFAGYGLVVIFRLLFPKSQKKDRFPKPEFELTRRAGVAFELVFGAFFLFALGEQISHFSAMQDLVSIEEVKPVILLVVFYLLVLTMVSRKLQNDSIAWTYELETELVLGVISPEVAIRKIENRRLGPRLQDVVNGFFDDLDRRFSEVDLKLMECAEKISAAKKVPEHYPAERAARFSEASDDVASRIDTLAADCREFREYLVKLEKKPSGGRKSVLAPVLTSLKARHEVYEERARAARVKLKQLMS